MKTIELISYILMIISILLTLAIVLYFRMYSPDFVTHEQFYSSMAGFASIFYSTLFAMWINLTGKITDITMKMTEFAKDLGEIKGTIRQYITNHPRRR